MGWDWNKALPMDEFYRIQIGGYLGWDRWTDKNGNTCVHTIDFRTKAKKEISSRDLAIIFDDEAIGPFYYRDWTESSLPYVDDGEVYNSRFYFCCKADKDKFVDLLKKKREKNERKN